MVIDFLRLPRPHFASLKLNESEGGAKKIDEVIGIITSSHNVLDLKELFSFNHCNKSSVFSHCHINLIT